MMELFAHIFFHNGKFYNFSSEHLYNILYFAIYLTFCVPGFKYRLGASRMQHAPSPSGLLNPYSVDAFENSLCAQVYLSRDTQELKMFVLSLNKLRTYRNYVISLIKLKLK